MAALWLITGGARSGKSRLAMRLAAESGAPVTYVATAEPGDAEMRARIDRHRRERSEAWPTVEEPHALATAIAACEPGTLIVDCLTVWTSNRMLALMPQSQPTPEQALAAERAIMGELDAVLQAVSVHDGLGIVVSNEVGGGIVPDLPDVRVYRELLGLVNQLAAAQAERVYQCTAGLALELKGAGAEPA